MTTLWVATTQHRHTSNQCNLEYLPYTYQREGREGSKQANMRSSIEKHREHNALTPAKKL